MVFAVSLSLINLILYCAQQLGVTLGVGAETVLLVAYLQATRDGTVDDEEKKFSRAVRHVLDVALFLIIVSGIGVIASEYISGQTLGFFSTIFLFKWALVGMVLFMSLANRGMSLTAGLFQGLAAATWYALFVVHILAPDASWIQLGIFYAVWLVAFTLCWTLLVFARRGKPGIQKQTQIQKGTYTPPIAKSVIQPAVVIVTDKIAHASSASARPIPAPHIPAALKQEPVVIITPNPTPLPAPVIVQNPVPISVPVPPIPKPVQSVAPVAVIVPASLPTPVPPLPPIVPPTVPTPPKPPAPPIPVATAMKPEVFTGLHVMPRTPEEVEKRKALI